MNPMPNSTVMAIKIAHGEAAFTIDVGSVRDEAQGASILSSHWQHKITMWESHVSVMKAGQLLVEPDLSYSESRQVFRTRNPGRFVKHLFFDGRSILY